MNKRTLCLNTLRAGKPESGVLTDLVSDGCQLPGFLKTSSYHVLHLMKGLRAFPKVSVNKYINPISVGSSLRI